jgi:predicted phosphate transport protein (TIGR00153 family)
MLTILKLFGRSPFAPLESHMEEVSRCVYLLTDLFAALQNKDYDTLEKIAKQISELEHKADQKKNDIRNNLPKSLFLPIDRHKLLDILTIQDSLADRAEDIAVMITLKRIDMIEPIKKNFNEFLEKNIETFKEARNIIKELHELLESSFGGIEAEKVLSMVVNVSEMESEVDSIQHKLLKSLYSSENEMTYSTFYLWQKIFESLGAISNLSENLAYRVRTTLESK